MDEQLMNEVINKESIRMNNRIGSYPVIDNPNPSSIFDSNTSHINNKSLLLSLSLRINKNFFLQNKTTDEQRNQLTSPHSPEKRLSQSSNNPSRVFETIDHDLSTVNKTRIDKRLNNGNQLLLSKAVSVTSSSSKSPQPQLLASRNDIIMEEMSAEEEQSSNFFFIETPSDNNDQSVKPIPTCIPSRTNSHVSSNSKASTNDDSQKTSLDKRISSLFGIPSDPIREAPSINQSTLRDKRLKHNRSVLSKYYTSAWIASQLSEEIPTSTKNNLIKKNRELNDRCLFETSEIETEDVIPISAKYLQRHEQKKQYQNEIIAIAKTALKPIFKKHDITKEEYKKIMKKVVTKAKYRNVTDRNRIEKMIHAYVKKYQVLIVHHHTTVKT